MLWATHGHTAAEVIAGRANGTEQFMGMQTTRAVGVNWRECVKADIIPCDTPAMSTLIAVF
jgi:hypothetical protein